MMKWGKVTSTMAQGKVNWSVDEYTALSLIPLSRTNLSVLSLLITIPFKLTGSIHIIISKVYCENEAPNTMGRISGGVDALSPG